MPNNMDAFTKEIIASICNARSMPEAFAKYRVAEPLLKDIKFVFGTNHGSALDFAANRKFSSGGVVRSLFQTSHVLVLDATTAREMESGRSNFYFDYSISLDTQAVSYLRLFSENSSSTKLPQDIGEVVDFIARENVHVDPLPYVLENLHNLGNEHSESKIRKILGYYEVLRSIDTAHLASKRTLKSTLSDAELNRQADIRLSEMQALRNDSDFYGALVHRQGVTYAYLLKMVEIQFSRHDQTFDKKMLRFLEFCHSDMRCISGREVAIAHSYFKAGQKFSFFSKIQKRKDDLFDLLRGMAWDMYHVRQLEEAMTFQLTPQARYFFPAFLTFDRRFADVIELYPLKSIAFGKSKRDIMPFYDGEWLDFLGESEASRNFAASQFYSHEARLERSINVKNVKSILKSLITSLEATVSNLSDVAPPAEA